MLLRSGPCTISFFVLGTFAEIIIVGFKKKSDQFTFEKSAYKYMYADTHLFHYMLLTPF